MALAFLFWEIYFFLKKLLFPSPLPPVRDWGRLGRAGVLVGLKINSSPLLLLEISSLPALGLARG